VRPEAKGELVVVLPPYDDSPVKDGWFLLELTSSRNESQTQVLTNRDMMDMIGGVSTVDVRTGKGRDVETGPDRDREKLIGRPG
jgi:hypothetical protein